MGGAGDLLPPAGAMNTCRPALLQLQGQGVHAASHVGHPARQQDANPGRNRNHRRPRAERTRPSAAPFTSRPTITREPSANSAISIRPAVGATANPQLKPGK